MNNEDKQLISTNSIFYKIKRLFIKIFNKKQYKEMNIDELNFKHDVKENIFKEEILVKKDENNQRLLNLQEKFRNNEIEETDISNDDIKKLNDLYDKQINDLQEKINENKSLIEQYKREILIMKKKV